MRDKEIVIPEGGRGFRVFMNTVASASVPIALTAADLAKIAEEYDVAVPDLTIEQLHDTLVERASDNTPTLGACCSGGTRTGEPTLELGGEWESIAESFATSAASVTDSVAEIKPEGGVK